MKKLSELLWAAQSTQFYWWILSFALLLRISWAIVAMPIVPESDCHAYDTFAQNLAKGDVYGWKSGEPSSYWPPGIPFIYSIFYRLFGHTYIPIVVFNLLLGIVIIGVSMQLAEKWFNRPIALLTGLSLMLWPVTIQFTTILSSELLFTALLLVAMGIWFSEQTSWWSKSLLMGLVLAAASYVRTAGIFIPILLLFFRLNTQGILKSLGAIAIIFVVMSLLIAPWSIRNTQLYGQFVLMSTNTGVGFWIGNNPKTEHGGHMSIPIEENEAMVGMNVAQRESYLKEKAMSYIKAEPLQFVIRTFDKLLRLHSHETIGVVWNQSGLTSHFGTSILLPLKIISQTYWLLMLTLGLVGIVLLGKQQGWMMITHPVIMIWGYFALGHAVTEIADRYHFYSIPMIAMLAALTITYVLKMDGHTPDGKRA